MSAEFIPCAYCEDRPGECPFHGANVHKPFSSQAGLASLREGIRLADPNPAIDVAEIARQLFPGTRKSGGIR